MDLRSIYPRWGCVARWQRQSEQATHEVSFKWTFGGNFLLPSDMKFYAAKTTWCDSFWTGWHSTWGQTSVKQNWEILLFPDSFYFWSWCFPLLCLKLPNKQPNPSEIVGAQCPAAKHRRSSASALLGAVMSVVRRVPLLPCMVQGSFFNASLFGVIKLDAKCCW